MFVDTVVCAFTGRSLGLRVAMFAAFGKDGWTQNPIEQAEFEALKPSLPMHMLPMLSLDAHKTVVNKGTSVLRVCCVACHDNAVIAHLQEQSCGGRVRKRIYIRTMTSTRWFDKRSQKPA